MRNEERENGGWFDASAGVAGRSETPRPSDLVFDFSGMGQMTGADLALLLTACQIAEEEDRTVWAAGLPSSTWGALNAMGLGHFFRHFPLSEERRA